jgi:hypothetical protein
MVVTPDESVKGILDVQMELCSAFPHRVNTFQMKTT